MMNPGYIESRGQIQLADAQSEIMISQLLLLYFWQRFTNLLFSSGICIFWLFDNNYPITTKVLRITE